jgi:transposase
MLIDQNKQPVGYEVYHGSQYEGHTLRQAIERLKEKYQIGKVICVADSGMMNHDNTTEIQNQEYEYIFDERLKSISHTKQDEILDVRKYQTITITDDQSNEKVDVKYYVTDYKNKKLITTYSSKRAARDKAQREERIEKARQFLLKPELLDKKAKVHFLKKQGGHNYILDEEKIKNSERFDGFLSVATNNSDLSVEQILDAYKQLYKIEQSFRSFKTFLETRPMYHWTEKRILGHLALCYISFTLLNYIQLRLKQLNTPLSENQIRKALTKMQVSLIRQDNKEYYLSSNLTQDGKQIFKALRIGSIPNLISKEGIGNYT